jgi:hypothetical protein
MRSRPSTALTPGTYSTRSGPSTIARTGGRQWRPPGRPGSRHGSPPATPA